MANSMNQPLTEEEERHLTIQSWYAGDLQWKLWPQQEPIYYRLRDPSLQALYVVMLCARQFGKSWLEVLMAVEDCIQNPGVSVLIVAPELKHARAIVAPRMDQICQDAPDGFITRKRSEDVWMIGDSELCLGGFDINNSGRQRGKTLHKIYIEEIVDSDPDKYQESMRSDLGLALTHSTSGQMVFATTLPKVPDHPFVTDTCVRAEAAGAFFKFTIHDNKVLTPEQRQACIDRSGGEDTIDYRREYLCEQVRDPGLVVVPDYDEELHVKEFQVPRQGNFQVVADWGGVRDRTVLLLEVYDWLRNLDLVVAERSFSPNTATSAILDGMHDMINEHIPGREYAKVADVPGQVLVDLRELGHDFSVPPKDDWRAGCNNMALFFTQSRIQVHPRCEFLRLSLRSGVFNEQKTDFSRSAALGHCDALAALMYGRRTLDRNNPYPSHRPSADHAFTYPVQQEMLEVATSISGIKPKGFSFQRR